jgi:phage protein D
MAMPTIGEVDFMAPTFNMEIEGQPLDSNVMELVESVEYESADGMADVMHIRAINPDFIVSNAKVLQPGNEIALWMGYGSEQEFIGRGVIRKQVPNFPQSGMPTVQVAAYSKDVFMMDNEPAKPKKKKGKGGRVFKDSLFSDAVYNRASDYGFEFDIDATSDSPSNFIQRPGQSDYEFVNGLANLTGFVFWVDGDDKGKWTLHFKDPNNLEKLQEKQYTFIYNQQDDSTLLSFQPEFLINGTFTEIEVSVKDVRTGTILTTNVKEENEKSPDLSAVGGATEDVSMDDLLYNTGTDGLTTASDVKLFFNDFSFNVNTNRRFKTQAEVDAWAKQWFRKMRENFILSRGLIIGIGSIRARQSHILQGVSNLYSGKYYFTKAKHICSKDQGYTIDFAARKVVPW